MAIYKKLLHANFILLDPAKHEEICKYEVHFVKRKSSKINFPHFHYILA